MAPAAVGINGERGERILAILGRGITIGSN